MKRVYCATIGIKSDITECENILRDPFFAEHRAHASCQPLIDFCETHLNMGLAKAIASFEGNWKKAKTKLELALQLSKNTAVYDLQGRKRLRSPYMEHLVMVQLALVEHCGLGQSAQAMALLQQVNHHNLITEATAIWGRIHFEVGDNKEGLNKFDSLKGIKLVDRHRLAWQAIAQGRALPPKLKLNADDFF